MSDTLNLIEELERNVNVLDVKGRFMWQKLAEGEVKDSNVPYFLFSPVTSCGDERSFSKCKLLLSDRRKSFNFHTLRMHLVKNCNS
ncbi:hypothetical protein ANN_20583 [Periplaneta americana]|uniref:HAT C-terminal dimerisation domain-containing protein n=1 Tax=Periplaneta americana TaxID=6978 RepID=A0ABQ8SDP5_PERAM|nr:hypothetical protein ANN_20583 [Periplaneta americana]